MSTQPASSTQTERQKNAFIDKLIEIVRKKGSQKPETPPAGKNP